MSAHQELWKEIFRIFVEDKPRRVAALQEYGLTWLQGMVLGAIRDEPQPMSGVAAGMQCDNSQVTAIADRLESLGLVERRPSETDRRVKLLALTDEGRKLGRNLHEAMKVPPPGLAAISDEDAAAVLAILKKA